MPLEGMDELEKIVVEEPKTTDDADKDNEENIIEDLVEPGDEVDKEVKDEVKEEEPEEYSPRPSLKSITEKYPNLFKDFPQLRDMYFREDKLTQVFATVEDAEQAKSDLEGFQGLEQAIKSGKLEDTEIVLQSIKELDTNALPNFAINVLPSLRKTDENAYFTAITPVLADVVRELFASGVKLGNDNLKNTGLAAALYFFGANGKEIAEGKATPNTPKPKIAEETQNTGESSLLQERHELLFGDVNTDYTSSLKSAIMEGLDPDEVMSDFIKETLANSIINRIDKVLMADTSHASKMKRLWTDAKNNKYSREWKDRILNAALSRAKAIMPTIRMRARNEALKTKEANGNKMVEKGKNGNEPQLPKGGNTRTNVSSMKSLANTDPRKIDWKKTSDLDILNNKVTLK